MRSSAETGAPEAVERTRNGDYVDEPIRSIVEDRGKHASVRSVYGDPIGVDGRTIVPLARVSSGFGGGSGPGG